MSVSAETYIVISLMFAVFAAVAAVGTSVVLGAGFERLRAGFELIKGQSGFFADAIYKLDIRTQKLDEETAKMKSGMGVVHDRMERVEKQTSFIAGEVVAMEQRILQGSPMQPSPQARTHDGSLDAMMHPSMTSRTEERSDAIHHDFLSLHNPVREPAVAAPKMEPRESMLTGMFRDNGAEIAVCDAIEEDSAEDVDNSGHSGLGTLLTRYFQGENDKGVIYH